MVAVAGAAALATASASDSESLSYAAPIPNTPTAAAAAVSVVVAAGAAGVALGGAELYTLASSGATVASMSSPVLDTGSKSLGAAVRKRCVRV